MFTISKSIILFFVTPIQAGTASRPTKVERTRPDKRRVDVDVAADTVAVSIDSPAVVERIPVVTVEVVDRRKVRGDASALSVVRKSSSSPGGGGGGGGSGVRSGSAMAFSCPGGERAKRTRFSVCFLVVVYT